MPNDQTIKLKLKTANVEIEYEGSESFLRSELLTLVAKVADVNLTVSPIGASSPHEDNPHPNATPDNTPTINLSVMSIASKLKVTNGPELALAACAHLTFVNKRDTFSRKEILKSMQAAASLYKQSYGSNLSQMLDRLIRGNKILQQNSDVYALHYQVRSDMEAKLGK